MAVVKGGVGVGRRVRGDPQRVEVGQEAEEHGRPAMGTSDGAPRGRGG